MVYDLTLSRDELKSLSNEFYYRVWQRCCSNVQSVATPKQEPKLNNAAETKRGGVSVVSKKGKHVGTNV